MARINISVPDEFLSKVDRYKKFKNVNRSQFLIDAAKKYFNIIDDELNLQKRVKAMESLLKTREELKKYFKGKKIDVAEEIRKMREDRMLRIGEAIVEKKDGTE